MKKIILGLILSVVISGIARAFPNAQQMEENFKICQAASPNWDSKWGKYVVTFELDQAQTLCNEMYSGRGIPKLAGCRSEGRSLFAGYVCDEADGGGHAR